LAIFIERPTPFMREFFEKISKLNYTKEKIDILIHNNVEYHTNSVKEFIESNKDTYSSVKLVKPQDDSPEHEAKAQAM
jgi:procollagen-lysine,2-oxoglutarate 5-dioxygenase, invertebrate